MEREGRIREGEGRGRRGGEMRKGIVIGGMVLGLLMGCNNGGEDPQKVFLKSVVSLGSNFLDVFTSFGEMAGSALGFKTEPKKSDVRDYFNKVKETVEEAKNKLNTMVADMKEKGNPNYSATESEVNKLIKEKLEKIIDGANKASEAIGNDSNLIGNVAAGGSGNAGDGAAGTGVEDLVKGIKTILDVVLSEKEGDAESGDDKKNDTLGTRTARAAAGEAGKLFAANADSETNAKKSAIDAAKAVGAVTGADILQAMIKGDGTGDAAKFAKELTGNVTTNPKDGTIAGAMALRAMAKGGKFANGNDGSGNADIKKIVAGAAKSAVTKALDTLTIAIRKTLDEGLKTVKDAMKINANANPITSETGGGVAK